MDFDNHQMPTLGDDLLTRVEEEFMILKKFTHTLCNDVQLYQLPPYSTQTESTEYTAAVRNKMGDL